MQEEKGGASSTFDSIDADAVDLERRQQVHSHQVTPALTADFHPIPLLYYAKFQAPTKFRGGAVVDGLVFQVEGRCPCRKRPNQALSSAKTLPTPIMTGSN